MLSRTFWLISTSDEELARKREELKLQTAYLSWHCSSSKGILQKEEARSSSMSAVVIVPNEIEMYSPRANLQMCLYIFSHLTSHFVLCTVLAHTEYISLGLRIWIRQLLKSALCTCSYIENISVLSSITDDCVTAWPSSSWTDLVAK